MAGVVAEDLNAFGESPTSTKSKSRAVMSNEKMSVNRGSVAGVSEGAGPCALTVDSNTEMSLNGATPVVDGLGCCLRAEERESGLAQGLERGRELGRADERVRLRRQAALKFGPGTADRLAGHLAGLTTREDLDRVGDWIIESKSGDELLSRLRSIAST